MATPTAPLPRTIAVWISRARYLRALDALAAAVVALAIAVQLFPARSGGALAVTAAVGLVLGALLPPVRRHWRPVSGWVGLVVSRSLRPGHRAWFVRDGHADAVLVTGRHGIRLSIAAPSVGETETLTVRRTRVFLIPT